MYYSENKFMLYGKYDWYVAAPRFLRALDLSTRNLIKHIEIPTLDLASAVCMMATMGFQMSHRLSRHQHVSMSMIEGKVEIWLTFAAITPYTELHSLLLPAYRPGTIWANDEKETRDAMFMDDVDTSRLSIGSSILSMSKFDKVATCDSSVRKARRQGGIWDGQQDTKEYIENSVADEAKDEGKINPRMAWKRDNSADLQAMRRPSSRYSLRNDLMSRVAAIEGV